MGHLGSGARGCPRRSGGVGGRSFPSTNVFAPFLSGGRPLFTSPATGGSPLAAQAEPTPRPLSREEEELLKECTFAPRVNTTYDARPIRARYL